MSIGATTFAGENQYYGASSAGDGHRTTGSAERRIERLLQEYDPDLKVRVQRSFRQWNNALRDYLRNETALRLSFGDEIQAVPVKVVDGLPDPLALMLNDIPTDMWRLLLQKPLLETTLQGLKLMRDEVDLSAYEHDQLDRLLMVGKGQVANVTRLTESILAALDKLQLVQRIVATDQDVLGAYFFRVPEIHLYWMAIGLAAQLVGVSVEALTVVVAAHELAHAYTHLGFDIDGRRWDTHSFARTELQIVEGMAQFYTGAICERLLARYPLAKDAYLKLLGLQEGAYVAHLSWHKGRRSIGEVVRSTMIDTRCQGIRTYPEFQAVLNDNSQRIKG